MSWENIPIQDVRPGYCVRAQGTVTDIVRHMGKHGEWYVLELDGGKGYYNVHEGGTVYARRGSHGRF